MRRLPGQTWGLVYMCSNKIWPDRWIISWNSLFHLSANYYSPNIRLENLKTGHFEKKSTEQRRKSEAPMIVAMIVNHN